MTVTITIPVVLRRYVGGAKRVQASGATVGAIIRDLEARYDSLAGRFVVDGKLHRFVNIYVDDKDVRLGEGLGTEVRDGASVTILSAMAGGT